jgi:hypothetical protein
LRVIDSTRCCFKQIAQKATTHILLLALRI